jgi:tRNA (mo5U34)-methyltransferase
MAHRRFGFAGFHLDLSANRLGGELSLRLSGRAWQALTRRRAPPETVRLPPAPEEAQLEPLPECAPADTAARRALVARVPYWYHTLDFGDGLESPGQFDHRPLLPHYRLPERLDGRRVLDVATFDGFWAFEFERRGAAEVVAIDLDGPAQLDLPADVRRGLTPAQRAVRFGHGFATAKLLLGSQVRRMGCSVYDLSAQALGLFDLVHVGDLLPHLAHPMLALQRVAAMTRDQALLSEVCFPELEHHGPGHRTAYLGGRRDASWWRFSPGALSQMMLDAGFRRVETLSRFTYGQRGQPRNMHHVVLRAWN